MGTRAARRDLLNRRKLLPPVEGSQESAEWSFSICTLASQSPGPPGIRAHPLSGWLWVRAKQSTREQKVQPHPGHDLTRQRGLIPELSFPASHQSCSPCPEAQTPQMTLSTWGCHAVKTGALVTRIFTSIFAHLQVTTRGGVRCPSD